MEVIPLLLLSLEAWSFIKSGERKTIEREQVIEELMIAGKVTINFSGHSKYLSIGLLIPSSADII